MRPTAVLAALALGACSPDPVDGGPCTYETVGAEAVVVAVDTLGPGLLRADLEVTGRVVAEAGYADGVREWVAVPDTGLAVGDRVPVTLDLITEGTCAPVLLDPTGRG